MKCKQSLLPIFKVIHIDTSPQQEFIAPHLRRCPVATAVQPSIVMATEYPEYQIEFKKCKGGVVPTSIEFPACLERRRLTCHSNILFIILTALLLCTIIYMMSCVIIITLCVVFVIVLKCLWVCASCQWHMRV